MPVIDKSSISSPLFQSPIKIHEIIFVWLAAVLAWEATLTYLNRGIPNLVYFQWGGVALTMIVLTKYFIRRENLTFDQFMGGNFSRRWLAEILIALLASVLLGVASWGFLAFLSATIDVEWAYAYWHIVTPAEFQEIRWNPSWLVIHTLCGVVFVPITEEIVFRGFVLRRLREKYRLGTAVIVSSFLFAVIHFNKDFLGAFLMGIILAVLAVRFSSLYAPIILHGAYNGIVSVLQRGFGQFMVVDKTRIDSFNYWLPELFFLLFCMIAVFTYFRFGIRTVRSDVKSPINCS